MHRRFISFGVIKGFLYRVHKYPILDYYDPASASSSKLLAPHAVNGQAAPNSTIVSAPPPATAALTPSTATAPTTGGTGGVLSRPGTPSAIPANQKKMYSDSLAPTNQHPYQQQHQSSQQQHQQVSSNDMSGTMIPPTLRK